MRVVTRPRQPGRLPDFLIIGAMKSGTTTLFNHLRSHPQVFMTPHKEPEFFVAEKTWRRGTDWYTRLFADAVGATMLGEASTSYAKCTEFEGVPERIHSLIPEVRLIYVLRHPIERIESMYEHMVLTGRESRSIDEAVREDSRYIGPSLYGLNLSHYLEVFTADQILVLLTDDLASDLESTLSRTASFLSLSEPFCDLEARRDLESSSRRSDRRLKSMMRDSAIAHELFHSLPTSFQYRLNRSVTRSSRPARPTLSPETVNHLLDTLAPDLDLLRSLMDAPSTPGRWTDRGKWEHAMSSWGLVHDSGRGSRYTKEVDS